MTFQEETEKTVTEAISMTGQKRESPYLSHVEYAESEVEEPSSPDRGSKLDEGLKKLNYFLAYRDAALYGISCPFLGTVLTSGQRGDTAVKQNKVFVNCLKLSLQAKVISYGVYWGITNHLSEARQM